jgi:hypothetical protein
MEEHTEDARAAEESARVPVSCFLLLMQIFIANPAEGQGCCVG